jgi:hypothetical protein
MRNKTSFDHDSAREHAMSQPAVAALAPLPFELVLDDGEPLDSDWHTVEFPLLRHLLRQAMAEQGRTDFFTSANIFVYYSRQQAREVAEEEKKGLEKRAFARKHARQIQVAMLPEGGREPAEARRWRRVGGRCAADET